MITNYDESFNGYDPRNNKKTRLSVISYLSHITSSRGFHGGGEPYMISVTIDISEYRHRTNCKKT